MGNVISWFKRLEIFVSKRREKDHDTHHSHPDHPERICLYKLTTHRKTAPKSEPLLIPITTQTASVATTTTQPEASSNECSQLYLASRDNKVEDIQKLLKTIRFDQIDRIEPNGSTALHAACYHGHSEVVKLLLEAGADRAISNIYQCLPFDEAKNDEIKKLFFRIPTSNRLLSDTGHIEWELINDDVSANAAEERHCIKSLYDNVTGATSIPRMFEKIEKNYIGKAIANFDGIEKIRRFFRKATEEQDPIWIIKAYTAETDFYTLLNMEIAGGASQNQSERRYIIALLSYHPKLDQFSYVSASYRVMQINDDNLQKYIVNHSIMTKSFLSSSISEEVAAWFLHRQNLARKESGTRKRYNANGKVIKQWVMCRYIIKHRRTALHIENSSQYPMEGEVLIMPYTILKVNHVKQVERSYLPEGFSITEIELEEWDQYFNTQ